MSNAIYSTQDELNTLLKDEDRIKEFCNYIVFDGLTKPKAWSKAFNVEMPLSANMQTKMYRWLKKDAVVKWMGKANKSLEVDWIDKKVDVLNRMHCIAMDNLVSPSGERIEVPLKLQASTGKDWLDAVKQDKTINLNVGDNNTVNIVQIVQDKLASITNGATINPDGIPYKETARDRADNAIDAIIMKDK